MKFKNFCFVRKLDTKDPESTKEYGRHRELTEAVDASIFSESINIGEPITKDNVKSELAKTIEKLNK